MSEAEIQDGRINDQLGTQLEALSAQVEASLERGKNAWSEWRVALEDRAAPIDRYAHEQPWPIIGGGFLIGLLMGLICTRGR